MKTTVKIFNDLIDSKIKKKKGRQSKATSRGNAAEIVAEILLKKHPNVKKVQTQVFAKTVDEFSRIDIVVTTKTNKTVYIPVAVDLWKGTSQQDRLQLQVEKFKGGNFDKIEYCYLCATDYNDFLNHKYTKRARRGPTMQKWAKKLSDVGILHNIETLFTHLNTL